MCYERRRAETCVDESDHHALSLRNRTQNSRVVGARPNHQADRGSDPNHLGIWSLSRGRGWRIHGSVEDTKLSTNKQHSLPSMAGICDFVSV